jgi:uncharacterized protein
MSKADFERAKHYALDRLARELSPSITYHSLTHTRDDVVPAVERLARQAGFTGDDLVLMLTAAVYHDIGFTQQRDDHEAVGAKIAAEVLPRFGYSETEIALIRRLILATKWPPNPQDLMEQIMADADVDSLGREDFLERSHALRRELALTLDTHYTDEEWFESQLEFLQNHAYFTDAARQTRDEGKQKNIASVRKLIAKARQSAD